MHRDALYRKNADVMRKAAFAKGRGVTCGRCCQVIDNLSDLEVGHIVALMNGGTNDIHNLRYEHRRCNRAGKATPELKRYRRPV